MIITANQTEIELLTYEEAAKVLRICEKGVYRLVKKGKLRAAKIEGKRFIDRKDLIAYVESSKVAQDDKE